MLHLSHTREDECIGLSRFLSLKCHANYLFLTGTVSPQCRFSAHIAVKGEPFYMQKEATYNSFPAICIRDPPPFELECEVMDEDTPLDESIGVY